MSYTAVCMTRLIWATLAIGVMAGCDDPKKPDAATATSAATTTTTTKKRPAAAIEAEITRLEKKISDLRAQAPRTFDQQKAKQLNEQIAAFEKRMSAARLELAEAQKTP